MYSSSPLIIIPISIVTLVTTLHRRSRWSQVYKRDNTFLNITSAQLNPQLCHGRQIQAIFADKVDRNCASSQSATLLQHKTGWQQVNVGQCVFHLGQCRLPSRLSRQEKSTDEPITIPV